MKVWTKVHLNCNNKQVKLLSQSLTNYIYKYGPISDLCKKYKISDKDKKILDAYTANRISGLLMLYLAKDTDRINDIANKYNINDSYKDEVFPEIEGYINK